MANKFVKNPLSAEKQKILRDQFISGASVSTIENKEEDAPKKTDIKQKRSNKIRQIPLRLPEFYYEKINELKELTGLTMNAIILEILIVGLQRKLTDVKEIIDNK